MVTQRQKFRSSVAEKDEGREISEAGMLFRDLICDMLELVTTLKPHVVRHVFR